METQTEMIITALHMRANYIETGNVSLSRNDAIKASKHACIKMISDDQSRLVLKLRGLAKKLLEKDSKI